MHGWPSPPVRRVYCILVARSVESPIRRMHILLFEQSTRSSRNTRIGQMGHKFHVSFCAFCMEIQKHMYKHS